ncbi:pyrophosphatase PpaX [Clostridium sp. JNZ J1-5]
MIKAVLFDLDGTLINTNDLIIKSFQYTFKKHMDREVDRDKIVKHFGEPLIYSMEQYDKENAELMVNIFREFNETKHDELVSIFDNVEDSLIELEKLNIKRAVVSSKRRPMVERGLKLFNIYDNMDAIITPEDTEKHKPDGQPALKACEVLGISPEEAIMVGDSYNDILCGKNAGCLTCLVKYTALPMEEMLSYKPDHVIDSLMDLVKIING